MNSKRERKFLCPLLGNIRTPVGLGTTINVGNRQVLAVPFFSIQGLKDGYHKITDIREFMKPLQNSLFLSEEECRVQPIFRRIIVSRIIRDIDNHYLLNVYRQEKQTLLYSECIKKADGIISPVTNPFNNCCKRIKVPTYRKQFPENESIYYLKNPNMDDLYIVYESIFKNISLSGYKSLTNKNLVYDLQRLEKDFNKFNKPEREIIADILFRENENEGV